MGARFDTHDRLDYYEVHGVTLEPEQLSQIQVLQYGEVSGFVVWGVDGEVVRNRLDVDFTTGGNPGRYRYVPPGVIWVEQLLRPSDGVGVVVHEIIECQLMTRCAWSYSRAHDFANVLEKHVRVAVDSGKILVRAIPEMISTAGSYIAERSEIISALRVAHRHTILG